MSFTIASALLCDLKATYVDPTLAPFYKEEYHVGNAQVGLCFMFLGFGNLLGGILTPITASYFSLRAPLIIGNFVCGVTPFFLAPVLFSGSLTSSVLALYIGAVAEQMICGVITAVMYDAIGSKFPSDHQESLKDNLISMNNLAIASGQFIGPIIGSVLTALVGFRWSSTMLSILILGISTVHHVTLDLKLK